MRKRAARLPKALRQSSRSAPPAPFAGKIAYHYDELPPQLQKAAAYIVEHPDDVALLSMRELARRSGVLPATLTRLAQKIGAGNYRDIQQAYSEAIRSDGLGFAGKAKKARRSRNVAPQTMAGEIAASSIDTVATVGEPRRLARLAKVERLVIEARTCYCLGVRGCFAPIWHFHYLMNLLGRPAVLLDFPGSIGLDAFRDAGKHDVLFVASVQPYTRVAIQVAQLAQSRGIRVAALTDSEQSPLIKFADEAVLVETASPHFFQGMSPAFLVVETIVAMIAAHMGAKATEHLAKSEANLIALNLHV